MENYQGQENLKFSIEQNNNKMKELSAEQANEENNNKDNSKIVELNN